MTTLAATPSPAEVSSESVVRNPDLPGVGVFKGRAVRLEFETFIDRPREAIFPFFADAHNLERITPPILAFRVLTPAPIDMREDALIDYRLSLRGLPMKWRTRIAVWEPPVRFVDTQLKGPYRLWHHEHTFEPAGEGRTRCRDIVHYAHLGGPIIDALLVRRDVKKIFAFRQEALAEIFG